MATDTYIELCQQLIDDAGVSGDIVDVENQTGELRRITNWIRQATKEIESMYFNWNFLHTFHSFSTVISQQDYPIPADLNLWDKSTFKITVEEQPLDFIDWVRIKKDATITEEGDPWRVTILPSKSVRLYDIPDSVLAIGCQYWKKAKELLVSSDVPQIPAQFRYVIVAKALQYYANYESSDETKFLGIEQYVPLFIQLKASELPGDQSSGALNTGTDIQVEVPYDDRGALRDY